MKKYIIIILFLFSISTFVFAAEYSYSASQASTLSSKTFVAGDVVTLENGEWKDKALKIKGNGTESNPILVKAGTAGEVILTGSSNLSIEGKYIEISGLKFADTYTAGTKHVVTFAKSSSYCRFTNSAIINYNPSDESKWNSTDNKWVSINGTYNRVDHCYFEGKGNIGTLLVVWLVSGQNAYHKIDSNHFYKRIPLLDSNNKELNGQETIRIGDSSTSMTFANCIIENNFFEECDGEIEIISNKSCGNVYRNNVFYNNAATLTLRHGNDCEVQGNYFFGKVANSGGIRLIGENHKVYNNYFQDLKGSSYRVGVCLINGKNNSALNEYFQVKNALVVFNTFYNCSNTFNIGYGGGEDLAPISSTIAHNLIFAANNSQVGVKVSNTNSQITWKNNLMYQGKHTNFSPTEEQFRRTTTNLNFAPSDGDEYIFYRPTEQSLIATQYKTTDYLEITSDIEGRDRPAERMIGAFELNENATVSMPTPETIGCSFINTGTDNSLPTHSYNRGTLVEDLYISNNQLLVKSNEKNLNLRIYNIKGQLVSKMFPDSISGNTFIYNIHDDINGLYVFVFDNERIIESKKILITKH